MLANCRCQFSHSVKDYISQKEEDIGDVCPVFEAIGECNDGWRCRWLNGHVRKTEDGENGSVDGWMLVVDEEVRILLTWLMRRKPQGHLMKN